MSKQEAKTLCMCDGGGDLESGTLQPQMFAHFLHIFPSRHAARTMFLGSKSWGLTDPVGCTRTPLKLTVLAPMVSPYDRITFFLSTVSCGRVQPGQYLASREPCANFPGASGPTRDRRRPQRQCPVHRWVGRCKEFGRYLSSNPSRRACPNIFANDLVGRVRGGFVQSQAERKLVLLHITPVTSSGCCRTC